MPKPVGKTLDKGGATDPALPQSQKGVAITLPGWVRHGKEPIYSVDIQVSCSKKHLVQFFQPQGFRFVTAGGDKKAKIWAMSPLQDKNSVLLSIEPRHFCSPFCFRSKMSVNPSCYVRWTILMSWSALVVLVLWFEGFVLQNCVKWDGTGAFLATVSPM